MKKFIIYFLFIFSAVISFAAPFDYAHTATYDTFEKPFFSHFIRGKTITYQVCTYPYEEDNEEHNKEFIEAFNIWVNTVEQFIKERKNGEKEFSDILKILKNAKNLKRLTCQYELINGKFAMKLNADLNVEFTMIEDKRLGGFYNAEEKYMLLNAYAEEMEDYDKDMLIVSTYKVINKANILHELGHVFGLADQYSGAKYKGSFIYNSLVERPSIMQGIDEITCDDVDGFITSVDRMRNKKRTFTSFCNDGIVLVDGKSEAIKARYTHNYKESYSYKNANYDADVTISYDDKSKYNETYIMDMVLDNFEKVEGTLEFLKSLGFDIKDIDWTQNIQVKAHAPVMEFEGYKLPMGLTTIVLSVNGEQKQVVSMNYWEEIDRYVRWYIGTYKIFVVREKVALPVMQYYPNSMHYKKVEDKVIDFVDKRLENQKNKHI